jgi:hypothetical protein
MADGARAALKEYGVCRAIPYAQMHSPRKKEEKVPFIRKPILRVRIARTAGYVCRERRFYDNAPATLTSELNAEYK